MILFFPCLFDLQCLHNFRKSLVFRKKHRSLTYWLFAFICLPQLELFQITILYLVHIWFGEILPLKVNSRSMDLHKKLDILYFVREASCESRRCWLLTYDTDTLCNSYNSDFGTSCFVWIFFIICFTEDQPQFRIDPS